MSDDAQMETGDSNAMLRGVVQDVVATAPDLSMESPGWVADYLEREKAGVFTVKGRNPPKTDPNLAITVVLERIEAGAYPATDGELPADFVADMKTVLANARAFIQHSGHPKKEEKKLLDGVTAMTKALTAIEKSAKKQAAAAAAADEEEELAEEPTPTKSASKQRGPRTPAQQEEDKWADARADLESKLHQAKKDAKKQEKEASDFKKKNLTKAENHLADVNERFAAIQQELAEATQAAADAAQRAVELDQLQESAAKEVESVEAEIARFEEYHAEMVRQRDAKQAEIDAKKAEIRAQLAAQEAELAALEERMKQEHQAAVQTFQSPAPPSFGEFGESAKRPREEDEGDAPPAEASAPPAAINYDAGAADGSTEDNAMMVDNGDEQEAKRMRVDEGEAAPQGEQMPAW